MNRRHFIVGSAATAVAVTLPTPPQAPAFGPFEDVALPKVFVKLFDATGKTLGDLLIPKFKTAEGGGLNVYIDHPETIQFQRISLIDEQNNELFWATCSVDAEVGDTTTFKIELA